METHYNKYHTDKTLQESHDKNYAVHIGRVEAEKLRQWTDEEIGIKAQELISNRREKRKGSKVALMLAATVLGAGIVAKTTSASTSPIYHGEKMYRVQPGDSLETIILDNVKGISSVDVREVEYDVIHNPDNADVLRDSDGLQIHPGEEIEIPKRITT